MSSPTKEAPSAPIEFLFQAYDAMEFRPGHPIVFFAFEEQPDPVIGARFPEIDDMRTGIEKSSEVVDDMTHFFQLARGEVRFPAILVYIGQKWRRQRRRKLVFGSINFYRMLGIQISFAVNKLRTMRHTEATIVLPGRFHPRHPRSIPRPPSPVPFRSPSPWKRTRKITGS